METSAYKNKNSIPQPSVIGSLLQAISAPNAKGETELLTKVFYSDGHNSIIKSRCKMTVTNPILAPAESTQAVGK